MIKGWKKKSNLKLQELIDLYNESYIKGYVVTDILNDGMLKGLNISFLKLVINEVDRNNYNNKFIIIAGGLTNYDDLKKLKKLNLKNVEGIISGKSFYVGNIDLKKGQSILDSNE